MALRLHLYEDGTTGLAAFCDTCNEQIVDNDGLIVWNRLDGEDWQIVHLVRCDPGRDKYRSSIMLSEQVLYLIRSAGIDIDEVRRRFDP